MGTVGKQNYAEYAALLSLPEDIHKDSRPLSRTLHCAAVEIHPMFESNLICASHKHESYYNKDTSRLLTK